MEISGFVRSNLRLFLEWIPITIGVGALLFGFGRGCLGASDAEPAETIVVSTTPATTVASATTAVPATTVTSPETGVDWLLVDRLGAVVAVRPDGSGERVLVGAGGGANGAIWAPDGKSIAFNGDSHSLQILDLEEGTTRTITYGVELGGWSPDGTQIVVSEYRYSGEERVPSVVGLALVDVSSGERRLLTQETHIDPDFHPRGGSLVFHWRTSDISGEILRINLDGSGLEKLTSGSSPRVSPDGCRISFAGPPRNPGIAVMNSDGTRRYDSGTDSQSDSGAVWSLDGRSYAFSRLGLGGERWEVWIRDLATDTALKLVPTGIVGRVTDWGIAFLGSDQTTAVASSTTVAPLTTAVSCADTGSAVRTESVVPLDYEPRGLVFDGTSIWVANSWAGAVSKLRASDGTHEGIFPVGDGPMDLVFDGTSIWVANSWAGTVSKLRGSDGTHEGTFRVGASLDLGSIAFDGRSIWVANSVDGTVLKLRASDGMHEGTFDAGNWPGELVFDGSNIWAASSDDGTVSKLRASDGALVGTFDAGSSWWGGLVFDGSNIWVANSGDDTVSKLRASDGALVGTYSVTDLEGPDR